jgi:shikimate kinase
MKSTPMTKTNIALIGFRATGKSSVGRALAARLGRPFQDMDAEITVMLGQDIQSWVKSSGWESFRQMETELLLALAGQRELVVACGGGVVARDQNRECLRRHFFVVWLQASLETIHRRLLEDPQTTRLRPPLTELPLREEIAALLRQRTPWYEEIADLALDTDAAGPAELAEAIAARYEEWQRVITSRRDPGQ